MTINEWIRISEFPKTKPRNSIFLDLKAWGQTQPMSSRLLVRMSGWYTFSTIGNVQKPAFSTKASVFNVGAGETVHSVKCLLCKCEGLSLDPQSSVQKPGNDVMHFYPSNRKQRKESTPELLASLSSQA